MTLTAGPFPESTRLTFRLPKPDDAVFYRTLMNEPDYHRFIADRGIRTAEDAASYIEGKTLVHFADHGVGLWLVELKESGRPIGVCGLVVRDELDHPDLGYAFLQDSRGKGYAVEAAGRFWSLSHRTWIYCACALSPTQRMSGLPVFF